MSEPSQHLSADPANVQRWMCFYPAYIDLNKTVAEGRLVSKEYAVVYPEFNEMKAALNAVGLPCGIERKTYPRDTWQVGRFRVQLRKSDGSLMKPQFPNRLVRACADSGCRPADSVVQAVFRYVADFIKKLPTRPHVEMVLAAKAKEAAELQGTPATSSDTVVAAGNSRHHSNKKNRSSKKK